MEIQSQKQQRNTEQDIEVHTKVISMYSKDDYKCLESICPKKRFDYKLGLSDGYSHFFL